MSGDIMLFPETWAEYADAYSFIDTEQVYTNGAKLIPCFRVEQWLEHIADIKNEPTIKQDKVLCLGDLERKCKHCTVKGETKHYCYCDIWDSVVNPHGWCNYGERDEIEQDEEQAAIEQLEHDAMYEPTFSNDDGSM